ncbi:MAG: hypothetical protein ACK5O2_01900 [Microthrixaceae bacterium]
MPPNPDHPGDAEVVGSVADARAAQQQRQRAMRSERAHVLESRFAAGAPGRWIEVASWSCTVCLAVVSMLALADPDRFLSMYFGVVFGLFVAGAALLALDVILAAVRSTTHTMGIGGLFFLVGAAPRRVQWSLNGSLAASVVVSLVITVVGLSTPELAFGTLVPTLQLSFSGLWGVRHGYFSERVDPPGGGVRT